MRMRLAAALAVVALTGGGALAGGLAVGDKAPMPEAKELFNLSTFSGRDVEGKVVLYEIFRTW